MFCFPLCVGPLIYAALDCALLHTYHIHVSYKPDRIQISICSCTMNINILQENKREQCDKSCLFDKRSGFTGCVITQTQLRLYFIESY